MDNWSSQIQQDSMDAFCFLDARCVFVAKVSAEGSIVDVMDV